MRTKNARWLPLLFVLLAGLAGMVWGDDQFYGKCVKITESPKLVNEAKQKAITDKRPILILYTKEGKDCSHCRAFWNGVFADGRWDAYAKEKKIIFLYVNVSQKEDWLIYLQGSFKLSYSGGYPVYALFHVKDEANCTDENIRTILGPSNVDCLGASYYQAGSSINGVKMDNSYDNFIKLFESYFADGKETYGLELEPEAGDASEEISDVVPLEMADFMKKSTASASITTNETFVWYSFEAVAGKKYNFRFNKNTGSSAVNVGIYANTGTVDAPNYDKKSPLLGPQNVTWGETVSWEATQSGAMLVKVYSEASSPKVTFTTNYVSLPSGNHLLNPNRAAGNHTWGTSFGTRRPAVVAFIEDNIWNDDTLAVAKAVQADAFTDAYYGATWYVLKEAQGTLAPTTVPELVYLSKDDKEMGRLSGSFSAADVERFAQYKDLEADEYEPENNERETTDGILTVGTLKGMLGGVDTVDWYAFTSTAANQKWTFTVSGDNASAVTMSITDAEGKAVAATQEGTSISWTVSQTNTTMYLKLEASVASPFSYTLFSEIKAANYTVQFGASDYTVMADANSIEIPVILDKLNYKAVAITVSLVLDWSIPFNEEVFFPKGDRISDRTSLIWNASEIQDNNDYPKTKTVQVMLGSTEEEGWWNPGEKEKTLTLTLSTGTDGVELAAENTTVTLHIRNVNIPTFVGENGDGSTTISYETYTAEKPDVSQTKTIANCITVPTAYAGNEIFWELIAGEIPEGVDIDIRQHAARERSYDIVVSGTAKDAVETTATLLFFLRKEAGKKQIIRGDEFTVAFTFNEKRTVNANTRGGWNLMGIPWDMKVDEASEQAFQRMNAGNIYTSDGTSYVKSEGHLKKGGAYWFFVKEGGQDPLTGIKDISVNEREEIGKALEGMAGKWFFGADPGVENCEARWTWNVKEKKFVPMEDKTAGEAGWWFIRKAE